MVIMKHMKIKAQRYWRTPNSLRIYGTKKTAKYYSGFAADKVAPVYVLPADAASVEAMVEQMAEMIFCTDATDDRGINLFNDLSGSWQEHYRTNARAALAAIGIKGGAK